MISFQLTEEQKAIQNLARQFAEKEIKPIAAEYDEREEIPWQVVKKAHEVGLLNPDVPEEYGGQGLDHLSTVIIIEEIAAACLGVATTLGGNSLALTPILIGGTEEQKRRFLIPFCSEPRLASFCLTEPGAGSDVASISTVAVRDNDHYVINGRKCFITNAGAASLYVVFASTDKSRGERGLSAFIVEAGTPGLSIGKKEKKLGIRSSQTAEVIFEDVRVPKENLIGREGDGFRIAMKTFDITRPAVGANALGVARAAFQEALAYSKTRVQFGKPISSNQAIQFMLADMATKIDAARLLIWRAAWLLDNGVEDVSLESSMAKCFASDIAVEVAIDAIQILGGYGYMRDYPVEKFLRDAKITQIYEGTNQIQRLVMARSLIKRR